MEDPLDQVVLLNEAGQPIGSYPRQKVHGSDTPLHLAFSSYLFDPAGQLLLTRRALSKRTWPGVWTNSCCGHPRPSEQMPDTIRRRVAVELQVHPAELWCLLPEFRYRARDANGLVENEICPVWAGIIDPADIQPNTNEVAEVSWAQWDDFVTAIRAFPAGFSPWAVDQVAQLGGTHPMSHPSAPR